MLQNRLWQQYPRTFKFLWRLQHCFFQLYALLDTGPFSVIHVIETNYFVQLSEASGSTLWSFNTIFFKALALHAFWI